MASFSEVAITLQNEDFKTLVEKAKKENPEAYDLISSAVVRQNEKHTTIYYDSIKWSENYDDIKFIMSFIRSGIVYNFIRVGTQYDDIVVENNYYHDGVEDLDVLNCCQTITKIDTENAGKVINFS